jgi:hypothetical protein
MPAQSVALRLGPVLELEFRDGEAGDASEVALVDSQDRVAENQGSRGWRRALALRFAGLSCLQTAELRSAPAAIIKSY